jgi:hypothetical protein
MRNYREIGASKNYLGALGSGRSQIIAPVRDSMILNVQKVIHFSLLEKVSNYIDETLDCKVPTGTPIKIAITSEITNEINETVDFS